MKILSPKIHGIIDYLVVVFLIVAPSLFKLPEFSADFSYILGGIHLALTVFTAYKVGLIKVIPFKIHGWIELVVSFALVGLAFYVGSIGESVGKVFYLAFAGAVFLTWLITDYK